MNFRSQIAIVIGLLLLIAATLWVYWPGLEGPFLFDDKPNLSVMNNFGGITSWDSLMRFIFEAPGATGRPLSLLTFALNDQAWPLDLFSVKFTNLAIHLLVCLTLFLVIRRIFFQVGHSGFSANLASLVIVSIFAVHPLNVSSVLYAVQRMTLLSAFFVILGVLLFLKTFPGGMGSSSKNFRLWYSGTGLASLAVVGVLSKENAFLLLPLSWVCFYSLDMEFHGSRLSFRFWIMAFWVAPIVLFLLYYFIKNAGAFDAAWLRREFTLSERLYTELNIVLDYLVRIVIPGSVGGGLYHEDYPISSGLLSPVSTLLSLVLHVSLIALSVMLRKKIPLFCFGILWFYVGHSLESTFIPLELYFEHRNYLPMIGVLVSIYAVFLVLLSRLSSGIQRSLAFLVYIVVAMSCLIATVHRVYVWSDEDLLVRLWAEENPSSSRSQMQLIALEGNAGNMGSAYQIAARAVLNIPNDLSFKLAKIFLRCEADEVVDRNLVDDVVISAPTAMYENSSYNLLRALVQIEKKEDCVGLTLDDIIDMYLSLGRNPKFLAGQVYGSNYYYFLGEAYAAKGKLEQAVLSLDSAYELDQNRTFPIRQALWLASAGLIVDARKYLSIAENSGSRAKYLIGADQELKDAQERVEKYREFWEMRDEVGSSQ